MTKASSMMKSCELQPLPVGQPNNEWLPDRLIAYAQSQNEAILDTERTLTFKYWRLGSALNLLRRHFDHGQWQQALNELGIDKTRASRARAIARTFTGETEVAGLTVQEAYGKRPRKRCQHANDPPALSADAKQLYRFFTRVTKTADSFIDVAGFTAPHEATELLRALDPGLEKIQHLRNLLESQSRSGHVN